MRRLWISVMISALFVLLLACNGNSGTSSISSEKSPEGSSSETVSSNNTVDISGAGVASAESVEINHSVDASSDFPDSNIDSDDSSVTSTSSGNDSSTASSTDSSSVSDAIDSSVAPSKDDSSTVPSKDDSSVAPPKEDSSVALPNDDSSVAPPKDDSSVAPPKDDSSVAPPKDDSSADDSSTVFTEGTVITSGGKHSFRGSVECPIVVDTSEDVVIVLDNATLKASDSPALYIFNANQAEIRLVGNSTVSDAATYGIPYVDAKAALFSEDSLIFSGSGSLAVTGNYKHAIACDDDIIMNGGNITVNSAVTDGVHVNDEFQINSGTLTVKSAGSDGLQSEQIVAINGGVLDLTATANGIKTSNLLGLVCDISIGGGTVKINSTGDAIRSDNTINISGGTTTIDSGNDGIQADDSVTINGGKVNAKCANDGLKGKVITVKDGDISLTTADDGINASLGEKGTVGVEAGVTVTISGGKLYIDASGDGIDSKGTLTISGGFIAMDGPNSGLDGMLAVNGSHLINGGVFFACDSIDIDTLELPAASSKQCVAAIAEQSFSAGSGIAITDNSGRVIMCYTFKKACTTFAFSAPELKAGSSYNVYSGVTIKGSPTVGGMYYGSSVAYSGGKLLKSFKQSSVITSMY